MKGVDLLDMQWSEIKDDDFYIPFDENKKTILGFWLIKQGLSLENIPTIFNENFGHFEKSNYPNPKLQERKVYLNEIIGTSHKDYGNMPLIRAYARLKRAPNYILNDDITKIKYTKLLKKAVKNQSVPIVLSQNADGSYYVDDNGNHRIIFYKMMLLSEIVLKYNYVLNNEYVINRNSFKDICNKYWLNAYVKMPK